VIPRRRVLASALGAFALAACGPLVAAPPRAWQSREGREHSLTGRVWDVTSQRFVDPGTLVERLADARFVLLGERHDNADHHRLQGWLIERLARAGRRPAVALEMLTIEDTPAVARHLASRPDDAAGLGPALRWERSGWPPWALYQPIAQAAIAARLPLVGVNLTPATMRAVRQDGLTAIDPALAARTGVDRPLEPAARASLAAEIREAHCGQGSEAMLDRMVAVQVARDAQMADALASAGEGDGAVLIAGAGHVRKDRGVPARLAVRRPGAPVVALAFVEVRDGRSDPRGYLARPVDYVWFTPRADSADPCERFRGPLDKLRQPPPGGGT
jgi:uncharacterized iron-regulated protein